MRELTQENRELVAKTELLVREFRELRDKRCVELEEEEEEDDDDDSEEELGAVERLETKGCYIL